MVEGGAAGGVAGVEVRAVRRELLHDGLAAAAGGEVEGGAAEAVGAARIGAVLEEAADDLERAALGSEVERGHPPRVGGVDVGAREEEELGGLARARLVQRREFVVLGARRNVRLELEEVLDAVAVATGTGEMQRGSPRVVRDVDWLPGADKLLEEIE